MKTRNILPLLLLCLFACMACEDETAEMPRLFRPSFIASSCFAEDNTITLSWRTSGEATSYTVELSQDATFQSEKFETQTVEKGKCTFANLRYETKFYARVRANNESLGITSNWTDMGSSISTLSRVVPKILYAVEGTGIQETSAEVKWVVSEKNPVDGLAIWQEGTEEEKLITLGNASAGQYTITGLTPRTTYYVALTNSAAPEGAEKYNQQKFTTAGMPADAVLVEDGVDLMNKITAGMDDASKSALVFQLKNGVDYYLTDGGMAGAKTGTIKLTKSIALLANPGVRPTLYIRDGCFSVTAKADDMPNIEYFIVDNVNIEETIADGQSTRGSNTRLLEIGKHAEGTDFTIDRFEIKNSDIVLPTPTVLMMKSAGSGVTTIRRIRIDNCLVTGSNDTKNAGKAYGFIHAVVKGADVWRDIAITNSTFYERAISPGILGIPAATVPVPAENKITISNCTFYQWATDKKTYAAIGDFSKLTTPLNLSVNYCVFGSSRGKALNAGSANLSSKGNYCTTDFEQMQDAGLTLISLDMDDASLFRNPKENDFTVIDVESVIYKSEYGDTRWIKVFDKR